MGTEWPRDALPACRPCRLTSGGGSAGGPASRKAERARRAACRGRPNESECPGRGNGNLFMRTAGRTTDRRMMLCSLGSGPFRDVPGAADKRSQPAAPMLPCRLVSPVYTCHRGSPRRTELQFQVEMRESASVPRSGLEEACG